MQRRDFLGAIGVAAAAPAMFLRAGSLERIEAAAASYGAWSPEALAAEEDFWFEIQQAFTVDRTLINLNNGGVSPSPATVQEAMGRYLAYSNTAPVYSMWKVLEPQRETVRERLARVFGCESEEVAITRNASEGLQICQLGFDLKPGDELLTTTQDYPRMINTWKQRERREGVVLKQFSIPVPSEDPGEIVRLFEANVTDRTRLILVSHMINITGQILPVGEIARMGRRRGIPVIVDGAHTFAHFAFDRETLDCDYYATSLHKWLFAPHGTGMLYVKRDRIEDLWPLMAAPDRLDSDIRKFEEIGTHPAANALAIGDALTFHEGLGAERKGARMHYLKNYWANELLKLDRIRLHTSLDPRHACGLATVQIEGVDTSQLASFMWRQHRIIVTPIKHAEFEGLRVTPNVYTTISELDRFIEVMSGIATGEVQVA